MARGKATTEAPRLLRELLTWSLNASDAIRDLRILRERVLLLTGRAEELPEMPDGALDLRERLIEILSDFMDAS